MKKRIHAIAGITGFTMILIFWSSTVVSELFGSYADITAVKTSIPWGMIILIPALAIAGASGMAMGRKWKGALVSSKQKRMPFIALNGLLVLVPAAFFLANKAETGVFDLWFYCVQSIELIAGATNLCLMGLNIRDGLTMSGRLHGKPRTQT
ncbi:MAG: hypothetical protein ACR2QV_03665 [Gammaproteobacteria bacterium]